MHIESTLLKIKIVYGAAQGLRSRPYGPTSLPCGLRARLHASAWFSSVPAPLFI